MTSGLRESMVGGRNNPRLRVLAGDGIGGRDGDEFREGIGDGIPIGGQFFGIDLDEEGIGGDVEMESARQGLIESADRHAAGQTAQIKLDVEGEMHGGIARRRDVKFAGQGEGEAGHGEAAIVQGKSRLVHRGLRYRRHGEPAERQGQPMAQA